MRGDTFLFELTFSSCSIVTSLDATVGGCLGDAFGTCFIALHGMHLIHTTTMCITKNMGRRANHHTPHCDK